MMIGQSSSFSLCIHHDIGQAPNHEPMIETTPFFMSTESKETTN